MTALDDLKFKVNCAAMEAIDKCLTELLDEKCQVLDADLPRLLPSIEATTEKVLRRVYEYLPEHFNAHKNLDIALRIFKRDLTPGVTA